MSRRATAPDPYRWEGWPACPCGCGATGMTLRSKTEHVADCSCSSCIGIRNQKRGKAANREAHRRLAPALSHPIDDDIFHAYSVELSVEVKTGVQIPARLIEACRSEWTRHAWRQAEKKTPVGVQAYPAIVLEVSPSESYMVVRLTP